MLSRAAEMFWDPGKNRLYVLSCMQTLPGAPGIIEVIQQRDADHYDRIAANATGPGGEYLVYETK